MGYYAGQLMQTGIRNTLIGGLAGDAITTGDANIIIGYNAAAASATDSNQLNIGGWIVGSSGQITMPSQPAFQVNPASDQSNIAVGSNVTVAFGTEVFDVGANFASTTFTAPVTGKYQLNLSTYFYNLDAASDYYVLAIVTSNRSYAHTIDPGAFSGDPAYWNLPLSVLADMDANDVAYVTVNQASGTAQTDIATGTRFSGYLAC